MKTLKIAGQTIPAIGLGTWHMGDHLDSQDQEINALKTGIEAGATVLDTAEMYGNGNSERLVGKAIQGYDRDSLFIIDKVLPHNAVPGRLEKSLNRSLSLVGVDYFDLYLYHWRSGERLADVVSAMEAVKAAGKIKSWGVSNFDLTDMRELMRVPNGQNCAANEDLYNISSRGIEYDLLPWQAQHHLPLIAYTPVAHGDSMGANVTQNPVLLRVAASHHVSVYTVMLAWAIRQPGVLAIPQSSNPVHVKANVAAGDLQLSDEEWAALAKEFPQPTSKQPLDVL